MLKEKYIKMSELKKEVEIFAEIEKMKDKRPSSFDVIGHIAIIEIPEKLKRKKKLVAMVIMGLNKHIKTVLEKVSERKGIYRIRKYRFLAGEKKFETFHKEYGCIFKLDPTKVYFSPRELTERQRIASQVRENETVMVMFAGVAPYAIQIAKKQPRVKEVIAIELNPIAVKYAKENVILNKVEDKVKVIEGDVKEKCKDFYGKCNRVVMPLPLGGEDFLDIAVNCLKRKGYIHFYNWGSEPNIFENAEKVVKEKLTKINVRYKIVNKRKVLPYAPRKWKVCLDIYVKKNREKDDNQQL
jgi:tRNA (guanine37-N1)-methyltransferase